MEQEIIVLQWVRSGRWRKFGEEWAQLNVICFTDLPDVEAQCSTRLL